MTSSSLVAGIQGMLTGIVSSYTSDCQVMLLVFMLSVFDLASSLQMLLAFLMVASVLTMGLFPFLC